MAQTLQLSDGTTTVDFLAGTLRLENAGWSFQSGRNRIWETFDLVSQASDADIRTAMGSLDQLIEAARLFERSKLESTPVHLTWQSEGESAKRAVVWDGSVAIDPDGTIGPLLGNSRILVRLALLRDGEFETVIPVTATSSDISATGGVWLIGNAAGTSPQRISELGIGSGTNPVLSRFWVGIRPLRKGTTGFIPVWECEKGSLGTNASEVADATASGGKIVRVSFATAAMSKRLTIYWSGIQSANFDDLVGKYIVLARCNVDAITTEVGLQLRHGWGAYSGKEDIISTTYISGQTARKLVSLGEVDIPPTGNRDSLATASNDIQNYAIYLYAERISGSGTLDIDCLILIPADHWMTVDGATVASGGGGALTAFHPAGDDPYVLGELSSGLWGNVEFGFKDWEYPVGGGLLVIAAETSSAHDLTATVYLSIKLVPRWKTFRTA